MQWAEVEEIQARAFHGCESSPKELELCRLALQQNPERYRQNQIEIRESYRRSLNCG